MNANLTNGTGMKKIQAKNTMEKVIKGAKIANNEVFLFVYKLGTPQ